MPKVKTRVINQTVTLENCLKSLRNMFLVISKRTIYEVVSDLQGLSHSRVTWNILIWTPCWLRLYDMSEAPSAHPSEDNVNYIVWFDFFSYFFLLKVFFSLNLRLYLKSSPSLHWKQQNVILLRHCLLKCNLYHTPVLFGLLCGESHWSSEPLVSVESLEISISCLWVTKQQRIHLWVIC